MALIDDADDDSDHLALGAAERTLRVHDGMVKIGVRSQGGRVQRVDSEDIVCALFF